MKQYTFSGPAHAHGQTMIVAKDEMAARSAAMEARWGPPSGIYSQGYQGLGLYLDAVEDLNESRSD